MGHRGVRDAQVANGSYMEKIGTSLPAEHYEAFSAEAKKRGVTRAQLARELLTDFVLALGADR